MNADILKARVSKGVKLLDKECPKWYKKVNLKKLDMHTGDGCVLGQVFGNYITGMKSLKINVPDVSDDNTADASDIKAGIPYGFWIDFMRHSDTYFHKAMTHLTAYWVSAIKRRKAKKLAKAK